MDTYRRYVRFFGLLLAALAVATAAVNVTVDPFNTFAVVSPDGLFPHRDQKSRTSKAERLAAEPWELVIIGSSRAQMALDPKESAWGSSHNYNAALAGAGQHESNLVAEFALACGSPSTLVMCVDMLGFAAARTAQSDFDASRFNPELDRFDYVVGLALGGNSLEKSSRTLRTAAGLREANEYRTDGFRPPPEDDPPDRRALFELTLRGFLVDRMTYVDYRYDAARAEHLGRIAAECRREGVELVLVILPVHALQLEMIRALGQWEAFEEVKRGLVAAAASANALDGPEPLGPPVALWDFTGHTGRVTEAVPAAGDTAGMEWFYESSHSTPALGREVIKRIRAHPDADPDFGVRLTAETLDAHLERLRRERDTYPERAPEDAGWLEELYHATAGQRAAP